MHLRREPRFTDGRTSVILRALILMAVVAVVAPAAALDSVARQTQHYQPPPVTLVDRSGRSVSLQALLERKRPVVLEFFYSTCTTICGLQTSAFANAQSGLGADTTLISITIDPEFDTPARLQEYARHFPVRPNWYLLTGSRNDIRAVLTAFDARPFGDNKMLHKPFVFIHTAPDRQWLRLEGLMDGKDITAEYRNAMRSPPPLVLANDSVIDVLLRWAMR